MSVLFFLPSVSLPSLSLPSSLFSPPSSLLLLPSLLLSFALSSLLLISLSFSFSTFLFLPFSRARRCAPGEPETLMEVELPDARVGDLLSVEGSGAYCSGMSTKNYNVRVLIQWIVDCGLCDVRCAM